ncbi:MAG: OPT/YSL family transporter [Candidatus Heteroscillospira sp.]|jgi:uncharacterized oligopeptide transporter (OPT) family protein
MSTQEKVNNSKYASSFSQQFTVRGMVIGAIGSVILTCSSMFVALKISSLPWPIMFVALVSMFGLKAMGNTNYNEINVTHTAMSAGAMVAGGLAFTIPGIYMLDPNANVDFVKLLVITVGGVLLGLIFTAMLRKHFIEKADLPYAMGQAAADVVIVGDEGGKKAGWLFGSLGFSAVFTWLRDKMAVIPALFMSNNIAGTYGSLFGIWLSPMLISVGYIIGPLYIGVWFLGALIGDVGILIGGQASGLLDGATASAIKSSLGLGMMVGCGLGIFIKEIIPRAKALFGPMFSKKEAGDCIVPMSWAPIVMIVLAALFTWVLDMPFVASVITILGCWLATTMSCQCVGLSGINPMEVFGILILIIAKAVSGVSGTEAFYVAAIVAVAAGLTGDVMNDFRSGHILHSDPKAQWIAEVIGGLIGAVVSVGVLMILVTAYGGEVFGSEMFPSAQAAAVASMVGGIAHLPSFIVGLVLSTVLYVIGLPVTTLGLGIYLPFYLSATAFVGGALSFVLSKVCPKVKESGNDTIVAAGMLGGEGVVGVVIALIMAIQVIQAA